MRDSGVRGPAGSWRWYGMDDRRLRAFGRVSKAAMENRNSERYECRVEKKEARKAGRAVAHHAANVVNIKVDGVVAGDGKGDLELLGKVGAAVDGLHRQKCMHAWREAG
eukprot:5789420-Pleurochrysis_carterae.AAC.1